MGMRLIFRSLVDVTKAESCFPLLDWEGSLGLPGNNATV
jgi:hypothetical protein